MGAGVERFLVEFLRRNDEVALGLTQPQLMSVAFMVGGCAWLLYLQRRGRVGVAAPA